jgi:hypothetical protein
LSNLKRLAEGIQYLLFGRPRADGGKLLTIERLSIKSGVGMQSVYTRVHPDDCKNAKRECSNRRVETDSTRRTEIAIAHAGLLATIGITRAFSGGAALTMPNAIFY